MHLLGANESRLRRPVNDFVSVHGFGSPDSAQWYSVWVDVVLSWGLCFTPTYGLTASLFLFATARADEVECVLILVRYKALPRVHMIGYVTRFASFCTFVQKRL